MKITRYYPSFCDFTQTTHEFTTKDEPLAIPWIASRTNNPKFHQFSLSHDHLMAEYREGREWWVAGYHEGIPEDWFPKWECPADKPKRKIA